MPRSPRAVVVGLLTALLLTGLGVVLATPASAAPLPTSVTSVTLTDGSRSFAARLAQPTGSAPGAYPVVAFGHGFLQQAFRYDSTLRALAARGYVVIAPDSETGFFPNHSRFADDLWRAVLWVRATQPNASATREVLSGHSMGGGAALIAASRHPEVDVVGTFAAAETNPSAVAASAAITAPALYVVGSRDGIVSPATTRSMYAAKPSPASWDSITGGYHCGFLDSSPFFGIGCDRGSISRSTQLAISSALLGGWFDEKLQGLPPTPTPPGVVAESK